MCVYTKYFINELYIIEKKSKVDKSYILQYTHALYYSKLKVKLHNIDISDEENSSVIYMKTVL